jgi:hypothetical protein
MISPPDLAIEISKIGCDEQNAALQKMVIFRAGNSNDAD